MINSIIIEHEIIQDNSQSSLVFFQNIDFINKFTSALIFQQIVIE